MKVYFEPRYRMFGVLWDSEPRYRCLRLGLWKWDVLFEWKSKAGEEIDEAIREAALDRVERDDDYSPEAINRTADEE